MRFPDKRLTILLGGLAFALSWVPDNAPAALAKSVQPSHSTGAIDFSALSPSARSASLTRGLTLLAKGDLSGAEKALRESIKLDPALAEAFLALAEIRLRQGKPAEAEGFVRQAMAIRPESPNILVALGNVLLRGKNGAQAEFLYRKALAIDKDHVSAYMGLGELYLRVLGKPKESVIAFSRAVALNPKLASAHFALGTAYASAKQPDEAIAAFQAAARVEPTNPQPSHAIGRLQASEKKLDLAVSSFSAALAADANYLPALVDRADALAELQRNPEAVADYASAVGKLPEDAQLWLKLGLINQRLHRKSDAVKSYQKALSLNPSLPLAYNNLAWLAMEEKKNLDQALAWSIKATALAPDVPQFQDTLGWIYRARGDLERSRKTLETATRIPPPQADVHYHLGVVLEEQGKKKEAEAAIREALRIDKGFGNATDAEKRLRELTK